MQKFIQQAIHPSKEGSLREALHVKVGHVIPSAELAAAAHKGGKLGQRARFAELLRGFHHGGHESPWKNMKTEGK